MLTQQELDLMQAIAKVARAWQETILRQNNPDLEYAIRHAVAVATVVGEEYGK